MDMDNVRRSALGMIRAYGDGALATAYGEASKMARLSDLSGEAVWLAIATAIHQLERRAIGDA
jgi:hypothetical protein